MLTSFQKIQCQQPHQQHASSNSHHNTTHNNTINSHQQITGSPIDAPADCTIACERGHINAHKLILCAHSKYLREILGKFPTAEHPIVILTELNVTDIKILVNYMYTGELIINDEMSTSSLLRAAQILKIDSLTAPDEQDDDDDDDVNDNNRNQNCNDDIGIHNNNNINSNNNRDDINNNRDNRVNNRNKRNRTNNIVGIGNNVSHENHDDVAYDDDDIVEDDIIDDENIVEDSVLDLDARDVTNQTIDMINSIKSIDSIYQFLNSTTTNNNNNAAITINKNANTNIAAATRLATNTINASTATTTYESFDDMIDNNNHHQHNMDCDSMPSSPLAEGLIDCNRSKLAAGTGNTLNCFGNKGASSIVASIANQATFHHNQQNLKSSSIDSKELSKIRCHLCNIGLSDVKCLYRHVLTRHLPEKWGYKCEFCDREFSRDDHLMRHYTTKHKNMEFNREKIRETRRLNREMAKNFHDQMSSAHGLQLD